ncbi:MAG: SDR family oxidoreductase [Cyanobacteria bacterium]|nr:SDR family oxidoreductase [Cyanobacteriota bacterium]
MRILVTGANGYIGQRLIVDLLKQSHEVFALVRNASRFDHSKFSGEVKLIEGDLLKEVQLPQEIDIAYYLVHSMGGSDDFAKLEAQTATNFVEAINKTNAKQIIYLGGISNADNLSKHLSSRNNVEKILAEASCYLTVLRAAIIIGSGSASFEMIRDLVEKLPVMLTPRWLNTRCQPVAIANVIQYLTGVIGQEQAYDRVFDIGGPDILNYKQMLRGYAKVRGLKRLMIPVPFLSIGLSSYWLYFITSINFNLAKSLVTSLVNEVICENRGIDQIVSIEPYSYEIALERALAVSSSDTLISSWKDSLVTSTMNAFDECKVPEHGVLIDRREVIFDRDITEVKNNIWLIGGKRGWYCMDWAWRLRGFIDRLFGGVGLRRGRRSDNQLKPGDALDFWRVLKADEINHHLILFAEMKLPGDAWLEFQIKELADGRAILIQQASFRPRGLWGRVYWYMLLPMHHFIFGGMAKRITEYVVL